MPDHLNQEIKPENPGTNITWELYSSFPKDKSFYQEWNQLVLKQKLPSIFTTAPWITTWWDHFGSGRKLFLLVGNQDGHMVALAPLSITPVGVSPFFQIRVLEFLGTSAISPRGMGLSDRVDFLHDPGNPGVLRELVQTIFRYKDKYDLILFRAFLSDSPSIQVLQELSTANSYKLETSFRSFSPYTKLDGDWETFLSSRKSKVKMNWRNSQRRLSKKGTYEFSSFPENGWSLEKTLETLINVNRRSYKWLYGDSLFQPPHLLKYYSSLFEKLGKLGWFTVHFLLLEGEPIAYQAGYQFSNRIFGYNAAYVIEQSKLSPGIHLVTHIIEKSFKKGLLEYDMMRGEQTYKNNWASDKREEIHLVAYDSSFRSRIAHYGMVKSKEILKKNKFAQRVYCFIVRKKVIPGTDNQGVSRTSPSSSPGNKLRKLSFKESILFWQKNDEIKKDLDRSRDPEGLTYGLYDDFPVWINKFYAYFQDKVINGFLDQLAINSASHILEIGCGTGRWCQKLENVSRGHILGMDIAFNSLKNNKKIYGENIHFINGLIPDIPFKDKSMDLVYSIAVLHHLPRQVQTDAILEIRRVLKDGKHFFILESTETDSTSNHLYARSFDGWTDLLIQHGFTIVDNSGQEYIDFRRIIRPFRRKIKSFGQLITGEKTSNDKSIQGTPNMKQDGNLSGSLVERLFYYSFFPLVMLAYPLEKVFTKFVDRKRAHYACILAKKDDT